MPSLKQQWLRLQDKIKSYDSNGYINSFTTNAKQQYEKKPRLWQILFIVILALLLTRCYFNSNGKIHKPRTPAVLATVKSANVPVFFEALGTVTPTYTITVRTQINGQLWQVYFREGQIVQAGDLLAMIDSRPYQAQLTQYQGQYARDSALLANSEVDLKRYQTLWKQNSISKQVYDTQASLVAQNQGTVRLDLGLIQSTEINLMYCQIKAPITGRIGLRLVDPGNYVQTTDVNGLAVINMISPITVIFTLPEDDVPQLLAATNAGRTLPVYAYDRSQSQLLANGTLLTMDNQVDPTTGTVKLKATFPNTNNTLFPNQFVNIKLLIQILSHATLVPTEAIQHNTQGSFIYVANKDNTVTLRPVIVGITEDGNTVINSGVKPGESVVIEGADKLTEGATIDVATDENNHKKKIAKIHTWRSFV